MDVFAKTCEASILYGICTDSIILSRNTSGWKEIHDQLLTLTFIDDEWIPSPPRLQRQWAIDPEMPDEGDPQLILMDYLIDQVI